MTKVIFRQEDNGNLVAVFPEMPADMFGRDMTCYAHIGQHSAMCIEYYWETKPAKHYDALLAELQAIGYDDLKVMKRISRNAYDIRRQEASRN